MKQLLASSLLLISVLGLMACQKSSDDKLAPALSGDFVGNWSFQVFNGTVPSPSKYQDNHQIESGSGYMVLKIDASYNIVMESLGLSTPEGKTTPNERVMKGMSLGSDTEKSGVIILSQDTIQTARKQGASEADIQDALKNPCKLILESATVAKYKCSGDREGTTLAKITDSDVANLKSESKMYFSKKEQLRKSLSALLGNTSWKLSEIKHLITAANGKTTNYKDDTSTLETESSSTQDGKTYVSVNAKSIAFLADLEAAIINDKQKVEVNLMPLKNAAGAKISLHLKTGESSFQILSQGGVIDLSANGATLTLSEDYTYEGTRYQKSTIFARVK